MIRETFTVDQLSLDPKNPYYIVGRACVLHELPDDLGRGTACDIATSQLNGCAGNRIACGAIGLL